MFDDEEKFYQNEKKKFSDLLNSFDWNEENLLDELRQTINEKTSNENRSTSIFSVSLNVELSTGFHSKFSLDVESVGSLWI